MCNKVGYETKQEAKKDAEFITKSSRTQKQKISKPKHGKKMRPYKCKYCGLWHLTTKKQFKWSKSKSG